MKDSDLEELQSFFGELQRETDRGLPLVAAALIDEKLINALRSFMCEGKAAERLLSEPNAPLGTFSARIDACFALGLIDEDEYQEITLVRKVRNLFAHSSSGLSFDNEKVVGLCASLKSPLPSGMAYEKAGARFRFTNATVSTILRLFYRDRWVGLERRTQKCWVQPEDTGWRAFENEKPPEGMHFVALGMNGARIGILKGSAADLTSPTADGEKGR
jgi:mannitol operon repressor